MKYILVAAILFASPALARTCDDSDNYAAQYKVKQLIPYGDLFTGLEDLTNKQLGDRHWAIRAKLIPWALTLKDACYRKEVSGYLSAALSYTDDEMKRRTKYSPEPVSQNEYQARGHAKMAEIPDPPK